MNTKFSQHWLLRLTLLVLLLLTSQTPLRAEDDDEAEQQEKYAKLSAQWWKWVYQQPALDVNGTNSNPIVDSTGAYATAGQKDGIGPDDKFFFLAGGFGGVFTRTVAIPEEKTLFFPVINSEVDNFPACSETTYHTAAELRAITKAEIDAVTSKYAQLNDKPVEIFRIRSPVFGYKVAAENDIYSYFGCGNPRYAKKVFPAAADGYWAIIPPLDAGTYTLKFGGSNANGFTVDVTYYLTVEERD